MKHEPRQLQKAINEAKHLARRAVRRRFRLALAGVCLLLAATSSPAQSAALPLGVNLEDVTSWQRAMMFVDAMKSARPFGSPGTPWDQTEPVDANGWPTNDAGVCVLDGSTDPLIDTSGTYHLSFNGTAVVVPMVGSFTVANQIYDPAMDLTTADIVVPAGGSESHYPLPKPTAGCGMSSSSGPAIRRIRRRFSTRHSSMR